MRQDQAWKNFHLGEELHIAGDFIYAGLRRFHEMKVLDNNDELFLFLYNLSVGFERLLKVAVVLLEHDSRTDQAKLEESIKTHNHQELLQRVMTIQNIKLGPPHNELLRILSEFYKFHRYGRFELSSVHDFDKEKKALCGFLVKQLKLEPDDYEQSIFGFRNEAIYRKYINNIVRKISGQLFEIIRARASVLNLYTYELRYGSRAQWVFLGNEEMSTEDILLKELLVFFMNTTCTSKYLEFLKSIEPLNFDIGLLPDYLECFFSDEAKAYVRDEMESLYGELGDAKGRLELIGIVGAPGVYFDEEDAFAEIEDKD